MLKKILCFLVCLIMIMSIVACGNTTPLTTVKTYCEGIKSFNTDKVNSCLSENTVGWYLTEDSLFGKVLNDYCKKWSSSIKYTIGESKIDGDFATVPVKFEYLDASRVFSVAVANYAVKALAMSLTGNTVDDAALSIFINCFEEAEKSTSMDTTEKEVVLSLRKEDSVWRITEMTDAIKDVITANCFSTISNMSSGSTSSSSSSSGTTVEETEQSSVASTEEGTFDNNNYYEVVDILFYSDKYNDYVLAFVQAKKDCRVEASLYAYDSNGDVIEKTSDRIYLAAGYENYFKFSFSNDISEANLKVSYSITPDNYSESERRSVEIEKYNQSDDHLFITFKQVTDDLSSFAKYKLVFYKDNQVVDTDSSYFSSSAKYLNGKGTTDVADIWVYGIDYDTFDYYFEPGI